MDAIERNKVIGWIAGCFRRDVDCLFFEEFICSSPCRFMVHN